MTKAATPVNPPSVPPDPAAGARIARPPIPLHRHVLPRASYRFFPRLTDDTQHPTSWRFPTCLDASVPWVAALRDLYASPASFPASFSPEAGLLLHALIRNIRPRTVIEVGSFLGASTIWMASALEAAEIDPGHAPVAPGQPRGLIHGFDDFGPMGKGPWRDVEVPGSRLPMVEEALKRAGLSHRVVLHAGDSSAEIIKVRDSFRAPPGAPSPPTAGVDFALIDGNHTVPGVLEDLWAIEPVLNTGGYILLHDTFPEQCGDHQGPRHVIDQIRSVAQGLYEVCEIYTAPLNYGAALLRRVG